MPLKLQNCSKMDVTKLLDFPKSIISLVKMYTFRKLVIVLYFFLKNRKPLHVLDRLKRALNEGIVISLTEFLAPFAITKNLILVTNNTEEFNRILELRIEDWK
jgi:hypothetical protein